MLIQLITQHPEAIGQIIKRTPTWVWGLLAVLLALGISQLKGREIGLRRVVVMPVAMLGFAFYGILSAFGASGQLGAALLVAAAAAAAALMHGLAAPAGTRFDAASRSFSVPGSAVPLLLIASIFMTKYLVGVELALQTRLAPDAVFVLPVALLYGAFNGIFAGRALRLLRLTRVSGGTSLGTLSQAG
jgi:hypothetical protein